MRNNAQRLEVAIQLAAEHHQGQMDNNGMPYILHCLRVMDSMNTVEGKIIGVLHDIVEDTDITLSFLSSIFSVRDMAAINAITRRDGEWYSHYLKRVSNNALATEAKLADLRHNLDPQRSCGFNEFERERYSRAIKFLTSNGEVAMFHKNS